ncbi:hypothetical protein ElyMa_005803000, partial [Elysia marginata]
MKYAGLLKLSLQLSLSIILFVNDAAYALDKDHSPNTTNTASTLICIVSSEIHELRPTLDISRQALTPVPEQSLMTYSPMQVLLVIRGSRPVFSDLIQKLQIAGTPVKTALSALMDTMNNIQRACFLSPAENRIAIRSLLETEELPQVTDSLVFKDSTLMAIHIDQENSIAISNSNQHEAITGLQQLGFHRESTHLWIGTNHSSDDTLTHMDPQELERYLHATSQTPCTHLDNETQEVSDASFRCGGSSGKKVDRTEG